MLHRNTNRAVCWKDGMYKQCENRFLFQITVVVAVLGTTQSHWLALYFVFCIQKVCSCTITITNTYSLLYYGIWKVQILTKKVQFRKLPWHIFQREFFG